MLKPKVFVVDDEPVIRTCVARLVESIDLQAACYADGNQFLEEYLPEQPGCLVLDLHMPQISGLEVHRHMLERNILLPVIILTGQADVALALEAMKAGVFDFVEKPLQADSFLETLRAAVLQDQNLRQQCSQRQEILLRLASLTEREYTVFLQLLEGKTNRIIGETLFISQKTVEHHRARIFEKMQVKNLLELARLVFSHQLLNHLPQNKT